MLLRIHFVPEIKELSSWTLQEGLKAKSLETSLIYHELYILILICLSVDKAVGISTYVHIHVRKYVYKYKRGIKVESLRNIYQKYFCTSPSHEVMLEQSINLSNNMK